jgi:hypothetical protein
MNTQAFALYFLVPWVIGVPCGLWCRRNDKLIEEFQPLVVAALERSAAVGVPIDTARVEDDVRRHYTGSRRLGSWILVAILERLVKAGEASYSDVLRKFPATGLSVNVRYYTLKRP